MILDGLDAETRGLLDRYGFDPEQFEALRERVASGELSQASNVVRGELEPPGESDLTRLPERGTEEWTASRETGLDAIRSGRVAQAVLAGGMATRFGGVVKGAVDALDGRSFLSWKLGETATLGDALGVEIPVILMTSFQTDDETRAHVAISNVDNLGARLDPVVVGAHIAADRSLTVEVAAKEGDLGGAPARVEGTLGLLEGPQFPPEFDQDRIRVFNTNSAIVRLDALDRDFELPWLHVRKQVDGRTAVQLERLYHQISWQLETTFLEVPRAGPYGRFFPIKEPEDLEHARVGLRELLSRNVLD